MSCLRALPCLLLIACGELALDANEGGSLLDTRPDAISDASVADVPRDSLAPRDEPDLPPDALPEAIDEVGPEPYALKDDPALLVPHEVAARSSVAAAGDLVAWVERGSGPPTLRVWDVTRPTVAPLTFAPSNLTTPRELALSDAFLVYVDDRFGDPDVFAIALDTGLERIVAAGPGAQDHPTLLGSRVAWEDCSACVTGDGLPSREPGREIAERDLATAAPPRNLTADLVADHAPRYGLLADGRPALAWVSGRATLRVEPLAPDLPRTLDVASALAPDAEVGGLALIDGLIAWRPRPLIVNPDSMIVNPDSMWPSDLFITSLDATTTPFTLHAELGAALDLAPAGRDGRVTWLESPPASPRTGIVMRSPLDEASPVEVIRREGLTSFAVGRSFVAFLAPRADNDGQPDLHVLPSP